ncbi:MAG: helix-turn-helix domain-containing protein [Tannerellaceae bacterium]
MNTEESMVIESRILEAAKRTFVRKGYEATKMGDVAAEAGIGRTALHYYYRTKEMLFDAIFDQLIGSLLPNIHRVMEEEGSCLDKIPQLVEQYINLLQANPLFPIFVVNEMNRDPKRLFQSVMKDPSRLEPILHLQRQLLIEMEQGVIRKIPLVIVASTLLSLVVFPLLIRNPLTAVFLDGDTMLFDEFLKERKPLIIEMMTNLLRPENRSDISI